ncbi:hypothetical protein L210DRAFT_2753895 [Boletus edulis BED1]|uniref:Uncharacterized protein n=1 Tax=Boletus edulis BED1 TaxID=1328754 RepID=A0AAD4BKF0_BOLED|nr:hypothetical protein L210DRAFT_2753895 [Boletus edulis BED1]
MNPIPTSTPSVLICGPDSRRCLGRLPASKIPRPHSCPPALSTWRSHDALSTFAHENPICDPAQSGLDVRTTDVQNCTSIIRTSATLEPGA